MYCDRMSAWQALCSFQTRLGPELWGWGTPAWAHWGWDVATPLLSTWAVHRWVLGMSFREMGAWQGPVGGHSTQQNAQEQSDTWLPAAHREMKGPEQRSPPCSEEGAFSPSGESDFGRNWLNQDGPALIAVSLLLPHFSLMENCCYPCCGTILLSKSHQKSTKKREGIACKLAFT